MIRKLLLYCVAPVPINDAECHGDSYGCYDDDQIGTGSPEATASPKMNDIRIMLSNAAAEKQRLVEEKENAAKLLKQQQEEEQMQLQKEREEQLQREQELEEIRRREQQELEERRQREEQERRELEKARLQQQREEEERQRLEAIRIAEEEQERERVVAASVAAIAVEAVSMHSTVDDANDDVEGQSVSAAVDNVADLTRAPLARVPSARMADLTVESNRQASMPNTAVGSNATLSPTLARIGTDKGFNASPNTSSPAPSSVSSTSAEEDSFAARTRRWQEQAKKSSRNLLSDTDDTSSVKFAEPHSVTAATSVVADSSPKQELNVAPQASPTLVPGSSQLSPPAARASPLISGSGLGTSASFRSTLTAGPEGETLEQKIQRIMSATSLISNNSPVVTSPAPPTPTPTPVPVTGNAAETEQNEEDIRDDELVIEDELIERGVDVKLAAAPMLSVSIPSTAPAPAAAAAEAASVTKTPKKIGFKNLDETVEAPAPQLDAGTSTVDSDSSMTPTSSSTDQSGKKKLHHIFSVQGMVPRRLTTQSTRHGYLDDFAEGSPLCHHFLCLYV
jgi:hypothetical protein